MTKDRRLLALTLLGAILALIIIYGDYRYTSQTAARLDRFERQVCTLSKASRRGSSELHNELLLLASRARNREALDRAAGNKLEAQADADSAQLYTQVAAGMNTPTTPPLGCN